MSYREDVMRTMPNSNKLNLGALGLAGEAGEVVDLIKKVIFHGKPLDKHKLILELGDVRWYLECLAIAIDTSMEEIERENVAKLKNRYPDGFTFEAANASRKG